MSSPCLSGGGRAYGFDFEIVKSSSITSSRTSHTSSPSSTLSEASNSPLTISTRKPRAPRKRPNQTYNEAAAILSTAYPSIFSNNNHLSCSRKFTKPQDIILEPSELLLPFRVFDNSGFLIQQPMKERTIEPKVTPTSRDKSWVSNESSMELCEDDLDAESILDEEIKEGIDSIMGNAANASDGGGNCNIGCTEITHSTWYGYPMGYNFGIGFTKALRHVDHGNFWDFPIVDMFQISPRLTGNKNYIGATTNKNGSNPNPNSTSKPKLKPKLSSGDKKKKKKVEKPLVELNKFEIGKECISVTTTDEEENLLNLKSNQTASLLLKLNYDDVLSAWSDRGSPFSEEFEGNDVSARLAQIDLFTEGGIREASVLRYKEKRRTRLFSKKIRYQVRKVNADRRPRMKGRFVRRPNSSANS